MINTGYRITSIDILRGAVMMLMALDHVRDFFHGDAMNSDPLDLETTTPLIFFTRWITHYCAPIFVFLAGASAYLSGLRKSKKELSIFLLKRGVWLIIIEFAVVSLGWTFNPFYSVFVFQVIWAIGISMVILGLLVRLPYSALLMIGLAIVGGHNLLDYPEATRNGDVGFLWNLMHHGGFKMYPVLPGHNALIIYPFLPWTGLMICGYCFGKVFEPQMEESKRRNLLTGIGGGLIVLFIILRMVNGYGDPGKWEINSNTLWTIFSFIKVQKYPPSLLFMCMTIGPAMIALALIEKTKSRLTDVMVVFGKVPFFYYVLHIYLIHLIAVVVFFASGYNASQIIPEHSPFFFRPEDMGFKLRIVYLLWITVLVILYPACKWFNNYRSTHSQWWLRYL